MRIVPAQYHQATFPEYQGNPLIEALPPRVPDEELASALSFYPPVLADEKCLAPSVRVEYLLRLKTLRQPLPVYIECFRSIETAIKEGYSCKNPLSPTTLNYLHYPVGKRPDIPPSTGFFSPRGCGITVIGESGVGKTCMLEQILNFYPDVIEHTHVGGRPVALRQVVWLKVDCPADSSIKALCHRILTGLDMKLDMESVKRASTIPLLLEQIETRMKSSFLGILVIDEMQNMNLSRVGGAARLLNFIHSLVNNLGIPVLFCANPPFNDLLAKSLKAARRAESNGYFECSLLDNDDVWALFVEELWLLQWTNITTPITRELSDTLYELSVGNIELAVRIFRESQRLVIGRGDEVITPALLDFSAANVVRMSATAVSEIRREKNLAVLRRKSRPEASTGAREKVLPDSHTVKSGRSVLSIPGDLYRAQHAEFLQQINDLQQRERLDHLTDDPDLYQRMSARTEGVTGLQEAGYLCRSLLSED